LTIPNQSAAVHDKRKRQPILTEPTSKQSRSGKGLKVNLKNMFPMQ